MNCNDQMYVFLMAIEFQIGCLFVLNELFLTPCEVISLVPPTAAFHLLVCQEGFL